MDSVRGERVVRARADSAAAVARRGGSVMEAVLRAERARAEELERIGASAHARLARLEVARDAVLWLTAARVAADKAIAEGRGGAVESKGDVAEAEAWDEYTRGGGCAGCCLSMSGWCAWRLAIWRARRGPATASRMRGMRRARRRSLGRTTGGIRTTTTKLMFALTVTDSMTTLAISVFRATWRGVR